MASIGPQLPPHLCSRTGSDDNDDIGPKLPKKIDTDKQEGNEKVKSYGPALPPGYVTVESNDNDEGQQSHKIGGIIGPTLPDNIDKHFCEDDEDSDSDTIGPTLPCDTTSQQESSEVIKAQFEARAKAMKNKLSGTTTAEDDNIQRESWMLELPPEMGKNFGMGPRTFRNKAVDLGDRSVWTDTPADRERKRKESRQEGEPAKKMKPPPTAEELAMRDRVEEYNKKTRPQSLLEMHREKHKKVDSGVRRPFDRDKDLALHRKDPKEKEKFIESAKKMNSKFSAGNYEDKFL